MYVHNDPVLILRRRLLLWNIVRKQLYINAALVHNNHKFGFIINTRLYPRVWFYWKKTGFLMKTPVLGLNPTFRNVSSGEMRIQIDNSSN